MHDLSKICRNCGGFCKFSPNTHTQLHDTIFPKKHNILQNFVRTVWDLTTQTSYRINKTENLVLFHHAIKHVNNPKIYDYFGDR